MNKKELLNILSDIRNFEYNGTYVSDRDLEINYNLTLAELKNYALNITNFQALSGKTFCVLTFDTYDCEVFTLHIYIVYRGKYVKKENN